MNKHKTIFPNLHITVLEFPLLKVGTLFPGHSNLKKGMICSVILSVKYQQLH